MQHGIGRVNWIGLNTLYVREVWRFLKVWNQTILAPVITTLLFLAVFTLALGGEGRVVEGIPFHQFMIPGLIMMAVVQNAFANTSSSIMLSKIQGVIVDVLMPPFSPSELTLGFVLGGVTRGVMVGIAVALSVAIFVPLTVHDWPLLIFHLVAASTLLSLAGVATGIWSQTFDQLAAITNYIITPLAFLSGTFYPVKHLPETWHTIAHLDPFFYMIDGFRYAMTGVHDGDISLGVWVMSGSILVIWVGIHHMIRTGYRLKT